MKNHKVLFGTVLFVILALIAVGCSSNIESPSKTATSITVAGTDGRTTVTDGGTLQMSASVLPDDATDKSVTWSVTAGTGTATITGSGLLTGTSAGTVTVTATAKDGSAVMGEREITVTLVDGNLVVDITSIAGVSAPVRDETPVEAVTETSQYTGSVAWNPNDNPFGASTAYTATITLTAKPGYTLTGILENAFTVTGASATNAVDSGVITALFPATAALGADTMINIAAIPGVTVPARGEVPATATSETTQYTGTVEWTPAETPFKASTEYTATITLTAKEGYTLSGVSVNSFTVAGATTVTNSADSGVVTALFPATAAAPDSVINIAEISGVTIPAGGATPVAAITATDQYTGSVAWTPADNPFKASTEYTATITLTAKPGYTLAGVSADAFIVAGATATNEADSGVVTAVFPVTETAPDTTISIMAIPGVTVPVRNEIPKTAITATDQYTGSVAWNPNDNPFGASTAYTAIITLTAKTGYTLAGVSADTFTVAGASSVTNNAGSGVVTAVFPETEMPPLAIVDLKTAGDFAILAETAITTTGSTAITGDLGLSPAALSFVTGFSLTKAQDNTYATSDYVTGRIYAADNADPTPAKLTTAISDMTAAYVDAAGRTTPDYTNLGSGSIGGMTLDPGLYTWDGGVNIATDVTLAGKADDVWIFQIAGNLEVGNGANVMLGDGAQAKNIFWQVAGDATLGTTAHLEGNILSMYQVIVATNATINGRALAQTQVTLDAATIVEPTESGI